MNKRFSILLTTLSLLILSTKTVLAQSTAKPIASVGAIPEIGKLDKSILPVLSINDIVANLTQLAIAAAGLIFFAMLLLGGIKYLTAGGDEKATASARGTLTSAFIGLIIVVASFLIAQLIFTLFNIRGVLILTPNK